MDTSEPQSGHKYDLCSCSSTPKGAALKLPQPACLCLRLAQEGFKGFEIWQQHGLGEPLGEASWPIPLLIQADKLQ